MNKVFISFILAVFPVFALYAQDKEVYKLAYQDSIRVILETNQNTETSMVGGVFAMAWHKITLDQQELIKRQALLMKKKKFKLFPVMTDYYGSIGFAVEKENADNVRMNAFLKIAGQVIENENAKKTAAFFHYCRDFFEYHALHYEKQYRLYVHDDNYTFEYIKDVSQQVPDTTKEKDNFNQWDNQNLNKDNNTLWQDDTTKMLNAMPAWMIPTAQPVLTGPILKFEIVTFNFATPYDSAYLRNTKGSLMLMDGTFVGERGSFGWAPAGLSSDSVYFEFKEYNFNVDKPDVKAEQGRLRYIGRVTNKVDGVFEFKSLRHDRQAAEIRQTWPSTSYRPT